MTVFNYFAFGSNLDEEQMRARVGIFPKRKPAFLEDYKLVFNKKAAGLIDKRYANIMPEKGSIVEGAIYILSEYQIELLDIEEVCPKTQYDKDNFLYSYTREELEVKLKDSSEIIKAQVYIANPNKIFEGIPTKDYLERILKGKDFFSDDYYNKLLKTEFLDLEYNS